jgi:hypothetical protein
MSFIKIEKCLFTGQPVIGCDEPNGQCLDGYYYTITYNGKIREILLYKRDDWANDYWINKNGKSFIEILDKSDNWAFFERVPRIDEIRQIYSDMMRK